MVFVPFCSQILYLDGSSSVFLRGVQPSPPVSRLSLGWPTRAISILPPSLLLYSWRLCSSCFPPSRLWSSRLAFHSVTVSLVYSLLLLECSYSPQLFCGSSWVSASCLAPAFGGSLTRVYLFCVFGLYRFGLLPFLLLRCLPAWWLFPLAGLLLYGCNRSLVPRSPTVVLCSVACLQSASPPWSWLCCFLLLRFVRRLSLSVVFLAPSRWGHPSMGRVSVLFPTLDRNDGYIS